MKLRKLILDNWCQHEHLEMDIANGLTGIVGPNGKGKSNIIRGLVYGLTGLYSGNREDSLRYGADFGYVILDFTSEKDSTLYRVRRNVHNGKVWLYRHSGNDFELISDRPATARDMMDEIAPVSKDVANQVYAVPQEDMVSLLREAPSRRMEIMARTFSLQFFERIKKKIRGICNVVDTMGTELQGRLLLLQDQASAKKTYMAEHSDLPEQSALKATVDSITAELEQVNRKIGEFSLRDYLEREIANAKRKLADLEPKINEPKPESPIPYTSQEISETISGLKDSLDKLSKVRNALSNVSKYMELPQCPPDSVIAQVKEAIEQSVYEVQSTRNAYNHIVQCGTSGTCPTCGAPVEFTEADLIKAQTAYTQASDKNKELHSELSRYEGEVTAYKKALAYLSNQWDKAEYLWADAGLGVFNREDFDALVGKVESAVETASLAYRTAKDDLEKVQIYEASLNDWNARVLSSQQAVEELKKNIQAMEENPVWQVSADKSGLKALQERKEKLTADSQKYRDMQLQRVQYDSVKCELEGLEQDIISVTNQLKATDPELRERLWLLHSLYQSKELPAKVAFAIYKVLSEKLNFYLSEFESPYKVELHENGEFIAIFNDGHSISSARLSGGEKMLLSISFRLALHSVFSNDDTGGFIFLDEPTTFLDTKNRDGLFRVLNTLKTSHVFRDLQIIIVTHDDMLKPLFDAVVDLTGR